MADVTHEDRVDRGAKYLLAIGEIRERIRDLQHGFHDLSDRAPWLHLCFEYIDHRVYDRLGGAEPILGSGVGLREAQNAIDKFSYLARRAGRLLLQFRADELIMSSTLDRASVHDVLGQIQDYYRWVKFTFLLTPRNLISFVPLAPTENEAPHQDEGCQTQGDDPPTRVILEDPARACERALDYLLLVLDQRPATGQPARPLAESHELPLAATETQPIAGTSRVVLSRKEDPVRIDGQETTYKHSLKQWATLKYIVDAHNAGRSVKTTEMRDLTVTFGNERIVIGDAWKCLKKFCEKEPLVASVIEFPGDKNQGVGVRLREPFPKKS